MASLENHSAALDDQLIPGLSFAPGGGASYITARNNISLYPTGSNSYSSNGTRVVRINVSSDAGQWIDPASAFLFFKVNNKDASAQTATEITRLQPLGGPHVFWSRARLLLQGQVAETIDFPGRLMEQLLRLSPETFQKQYAGHGFGLQVPNPDESTDLRQQRRLTPSQGKTVAMPLSLFGLFAQHRYLPVGFAMNMQIELTVQSGSDCCRSGTSVAGGVTTTYTNLFEISDVIMRCDAITLDSQLQESYQQMSLTRSLSIPYKTWHHTVYSQTGNADSVTVAMQRSVSRLCTVFVTFMSAERDTLKDVNYFPSVEGQPDGFDGSHPLLTTDCTPDEKSIQYEMVIDGQRYPTAQVQTTVEAYTALIRGLGMAGQTSHAVGVGGRYFETTDFAICQDFEKHLGSALSGKNLRGGSQLLINLKGLAPSGIPSADKIVKIYVCAQIDCIAELSSGGVTILE